MEDAVRTFYLNIFGLLRFQAKSVGVKKSYLKKNHLHYHLVDIFKVST